MSSRLLSRAAGVLASISLAFWCFGAQADVYKDLSALISSGNVSEAMEHAQKHLKEHPRDAQMRFLFSSAQTASGDIAGAIETLTELIKEYPELPEPHNNLAAIYASQGELLQAKNQLLEALRSNPAYPVAHENLGDVYLRLALEAYTASSKLQGAVPALEAKLKGVRALVSP